MTINTQPLTAPNEGEWLDQAVEAARYAFNHTPRRRDMDYAAPMRTALRAALPHIRAHIADEIRKRGDEVNLHGIEDPLPRDWKELGKSEAYETAARIAEGIES